MTTDHLSIQIPTEKLAPRELEVITLTAYGKTRGEISQLLHVSEETIKAYIERARLKLKAVNKTHATTIAITLGLIAPYRLATLPNKKMSHVPQTGTAPACKCSVSTRRRHPHKDKQD